MKIEVCPFGSCTAPAALRLEQIVVGVGREKKRSAYVVCWECGARGPIRKFDDDAITDWNEMVKALTAWRLNKMNSSKNRQKVSGDEGQ